MAQLVEHILGKDEVPSSNLGSSSRKTPIVRSGLLVFLELLLLERARLCCFATESSSHIPTVDRQARLPGERSVYLRLWRIPGCSRKGAESFRCNRKKQCETCKVTALTISSLNNGWKSQDFPAIMLFSIGVSSLDVH